MDDLLQQLEMRLRSLIQKYELSKNQNTSLQQTQILLSREKELLLAKNKVAISQIENMVLRLKSIEKSHE